MTHRIIIALIISLAVFLPACKQKAAKQPTISIITVAGTARFKSNGAICKPGDPIKPGDTIKTEKNSIVELKVPKQSGIRIYENTEFTVSKCVFGNDGVNTKAEYSLKSGKSLFIVDKLIKRPNVTIRTPTAVASVRGTTFTIKVTDENTTTPLALKVIVQEGTVRLEPIEKPNKDFVIVSGEYIEISGIKIIPGKASDLDMESIEDDAEALNSNIKTAEVTDEPSENKTELEKTEESAKPEDKKEDIKKAAPVLKTETAIRNYYNKLEEINLDDGSSIRGAVLSQDNSNIRIHTIHGIIQVPTASVINIRMR
jgi:hypothetical protein